MNSVARKFDIAKTTKEFHKKHHSYHIWQRIVAGLSCIVVFCTTYALIIPAITLEKKEPICGYEAHLHTDDCYAPVHVHTSECYQPNGREPYVCPVHAGEAPTYCGYADFVLHTHSAGCYDADGTLVCTLPEISEHVHGEGCYSQPEEAAGNETLTETPEGEGEGETADSPENGDAPALTPADGDQSKSDEAVEPTADSDIPTEPVTDAEAEDTAALSVTAEHNGKLLGAQGDTDTIEPMDTEAVTEAEPVTETVTESETEVVTEPDAPESEPTAPILTCTLPEVQYHQHTAACYADGALICGKTQVLYPAYTTAGAVCKNENGAVMVCTCGMEEHEHVDACYPDDREPSYVKGDVYHCGFGEHTHTDACYDAEGTLICTLPEHTHTDACKNPDNQEENRYVCGMEAHLHTVACFGEDGTLTCQIPVHEHTEDCLPPTYYCGLPEHAHTAECLDENGELICAAEEHTHSAQCTSNPDADIESKEEWEATLPARTGNARYDLTAVAQSQLGTAESRENFYVDETGAQRGITRYGQFSGDPYTKNYDNWSAYFVNFCLHYAVEESIEETLFVANADMWMQGLLDAGKFVSKTELSAASSAADSENMTLDSAALDAPDAEAAEQACAAAPGDIAFFDRNGDGSADSVGIVIGYDAETGVFQVMEGDWDGMGAVETQSIASPADDAALLGFGVLFDEPYLETLTEEEQAEVDAVIGWIDAIPSLDEIEATMAELENGGTIEVDGEEIDEEVYMERLTSQVSFVYTYYHSYLTPAQQAHVTNAEKLEQYEWLNVEMLALTEDYTCNVYGVNSFSTSANVNGRKYSTIYNKKTTFTNSTTSNAKPNKYWLAYVMTPVSGQKNTFQITYISPVGAAEDGPLEVPKDGFIHMINLDGEGNPYADFLEKSGAKMSSYVTVSDEFWTKDFSVFGNTSYGTITYWVDEPDIGLKKEKNNVIEKVTTTPTKDFITLNLYDYKTGINTKYNGNVPGPDQYPGFSKDDGTTTYTEDAHNSSSRWTGLPSFGSNIKTDEAGNIGSVQSSSKGNSINGMINSTSPDIKFDNTEYPSSTANKYVNSPGNYSISYQFPSFGSNKGVMKPKLNENGYPELANGISLEYLFSEQESYVEKMNTHNSIDGLFQYNPDTGVYSYDSRRNHAQFVAGDGINTIDHFDVYDAILTPNYLMYAFGNFLPLNDIIKDCEQVSKIDKNYLERIAATALDKYNKYESDLYHNLIQDKQAYRTLSTVMTNYINIMTKKFGENWNMETGARDYYNRKSGIPYPTTTQEMIDTGVLSLDKIYSLDYDEPSNFFFGMEMKMNFMQSKNGKTTKGQPMVLSFIGDDDVWFYIDDYLFLDLSGIHRQVGGQIDFEKGEVRYYRLNHKYGDVVMDKDSLIKTVKFTEILGEEGKHLLNSKGTFKNYSFHSLNFYYMERGAGSGVCRLEFNMEQSIPTSINKVDQYGDPIEGAKFAVYHAIPDVNDNSIYRYYNCTVGETATEEHSHDSCMKGTPILVPENIVPDKDGVIQYTDSSGTLITIHPCYTGITNAEGTLTFVNKAENTYYSISQMKDLFGQNFILREYFIPNGYRTVADEIHLKIENDTIQCDNPYLSGSWAGPNALVTGSTILTRAVTRGIYQGAYDKIYKAHPEWIVGNKESNQIQYINGNKKQGILFAVVLKRNKDAPLPEGDIRNWKNIDFSQWYPVYGSNKDGYTVLSNLTGTATDGTNGETIHHNLNEVVEAAKAAQAFGENVFNIGISGQPQLVIENAPGSADQYLSYILENGLNTETAKEKLQYTVAYYYAPVESLDDVTAENIVRISTHFDKKLDGTPNQNTFTVLWGSTISVPNIENRFLIQKASPDAPDKFLTDAVFAMYNVGETDDGKLYYIANDGTSSKEGTHIYLEPDDDGDNRGRAGLSPDTLDGTYEIQTKDITIPTTHTGNVILANGGNIEVTINGQSYTISPAVNAANERLVTYSHDSCDLVKENTTAHFTALTEGRYILREIKSPAGYALNTAEIKVVVNGSGIYVNAGNQGNDVIVGNGAGYIVASMENTARDGTDKTLSWIYTMLGVNPSQSFNGVFNEDGTLKTDGTYAAKTEGDTTPGYASGTTKNKSDAMVTYLTYDDAKDHAQTTNNGTLFDYYPDGTQNKFSRTGLQSGQHTQLLFTETGWSELAVYQDYLYGSEQIKTNPQNPVYADRHNENLTSLFSKSRFVRFTDQRLNDLKIVKVDAYDSSKKLSGAAFALSRVFGDEERFYQYLNGQASYVVPAENQTASNFPISVDSKGELIFCDLTSGVYKLYEVTAPEGYKLLSDPITITVKNGKIETVDSNGKDIFALSNPGDPVNNTPMEMRVINSNSYTLPMTGVFGGTFFCTFGGLLFMAAPIVYILCTGRCTNKGRRRKKERRVNAR